MYINSIRKIWNSIAKSDIDEEPNFETDFDHIIELFHFGDSYYYIFNLQNSVIEYVHPKVEEIIGVKPEDFTTEKFMEIVHHDDLPHFMNMENTAIKFALNFTPEKLENYKVRSDFRVIHQQSQETIRILRHIHPLQFTANKGVLLCLGIQTDISYLKPFGKPILSFIGLNGAPNYINIEVEEVFKPTNEILTPREKEILKLLHKGESSKQVAQELHLSEATVNTHSRNILCKTQCTSIQEVIYKAIENGWI
ncbi:LuxR C-terminal-related transcriptional regulator [Faecalibacter rhinopitheci]|uniref:PAS domain-containing protein n=1 Tax=Faecalibacter rhinopitheci TaxID=2779678 RepID=A0A8J7FWE1_9FLAO|nr:LuxR C-terminal-related transcriptional regulator [Faecalibacter rhinopitheci]MBF0596778.1 PAS domain-containing protein [Faecalibacter rhinopitheci]